MIAVVDTGVDLDHPDLESKLVEGESFVLLSQSAQDSEGHGTHVSSIAAAASDNGVGVAGVAWQVGIMPVKSLNAFGAGQTSNVAEGILWAVDNGVDIINLSLGSSESSSTLGDAIQYAYANDVFIVASMGNEYNQGNPTFYPAAYPEVFAVGAIDQDWNRASFSNTGTHVDVVAPGVEIYGAAIPASGFEYVALDGTSMATPFVSGLAALLLSVDPTLTNAQLAETIRSTAIDIGTAGWDESTGMGLIDAQAAVETLFVESILDQSIYVPLLMN